MANANVTHAEAKSICDKLECSPSQHDASGHHGGKPNIGVTDKSSEAVTGGTHLATHTSEFHMSDRGKKIAGYGGKFAPKAGQS